MPTTTGDVSIDLNMVGSTVNHGVRLGNNVLGGVADQGNLIGLTIGLTLAIGLLIGLIFLIIKVGPKLINSVKGYHKGSE